MEGLSEASVALAFGGALTIHAYKDQILAALGSVDQAFLRLLRRQPKAQITEIDNAYAGRHRLDLSKPCYRHDRWMTWHEVSLDAQP